MAINLNNYEEYLLSHIDGELDTAAEKELMQFLQEHPELREELEVLQATRLAPEEGRLFGDKSVLYRREEEKRPVPLYRKWWLTAAAAAVILVFAGIPFLHRTASLKNIPGVAVTHPKAPNILVQTPAYPAKAPGGKKQQEGPAIAANRPEKTRHHRERSGAPVANHKNSLPGENKDAASLPVAINNPGNNPPAINKLPDTGRETPPSSIAANNRSAPGNAEKNDRSGKAAQPQQAITQPLLADVHQAGAEKPLRAPEEPARLIAAKESLDEKITDKVAGAQDFVAHKLETLKKKGIKIGRLEIVMN